MRGTFRGEPVPVLRVILAEQSRVQGGGPGRESSARGGQKKSLQWEVAIGEVKQENEVTIVLTRVRKEREEVRGSSSV